MNPITTGLGIALVVVSLGLAITFKSLGVCNENRAALRQQVADLEVKVEEQNKKVEEWAKEAKKRTQAASQALEGERLRGRGLQAEAARLKAAIKAPAATLSSCPAADAVKVIREGLKVLP